MYFRNMDLKKFEQIEKNKINQLNDTEKIAKDFIENITINKNTLYFNPFPIYFKNVKTTTDTFLAFITTDYIVFLK